MTVVGKVGVKAVFSLHFNVFLSKIQLIQPFRSLDGITNSQLAPESKILSAVPKELLSL